MPSPSVLALNYKTVFHNVGRRFVNLDSLPCVLGFRGRRQQPLPLCQAAPPGPSLGHPYNRLFILTPGRPHGHAFAHCCHARSEADLIAVGRQSQCNPNIAHHWAHDLGINRRFEDWTPEYGWWLEKRIKTTEGFATPTGAVIPRR